MNQIKTRYGEKKRRGLQMYGPGCCGHERGHKGAIGGFNEDKVEALKKWRAGTAAWAQGASRLFGRSHRPY